MVQHNAAQQHRATKIEHDGKVVDIDDKLVPLMKALWNAGMETRMSCEDNLPRGCCWIQFATKEDRARFLAIAECISVGRRPRRELVFIVSGCVMIRFPQVYLEVLTLAFQAYQKVPLGDRDKPFAFHSTARVAAHTTGFLHQLKYTQDRKD